MLYTAAIQYKLLCPGAEQGSLTIRIMVTGESNINTWYSLYTQDGG